MTAHTDSPSGAPCWIELFTSDPAGATAFYGALFGWHATPPDEELGGYVNFTSHGTRVAGMMHNAVPDGPPDFWTTYLSVPDAATAVEAAQAAGAQVHVQAMPVADLGAMAVVADPSGAAIGLWQPGTHRGFGRVAEVGAPCWFELLTRDYDRAVDFYRTAIGWQTQEVEEMTDPRYTMAVADGEPFAGVMDAAKFLPEGVPSVWLTYLGVEDTDAACKQAEALGGRVIESPSDMPYGRMAQLADPTGTVFKIVSAPVG